MLERYTDATPNGLKISIGLEEMGLDYKVHQVFLGGEQFTPEFTALNPNRKIPVLVDNEFVLTVPLSLIISRPPINRARIGSWVNLIF
jgi:GST-like protein